MYTVTASRKELKECFKKENDIGFLIKNKRIDVDLEPIVKLFGKIYTQSENKTN